MALTLVFFLYKRYKENFTFTNKNLADIINQASHYVTWWSTTISWAFFLNVPVYALGDTQAAALGELYYGGGKNLSNFFYLTISTGIGGSIIQNKNLFNYYM